MPLQFWPTESSIRRADGVFMRSTPRPAPLCGGPPYLQTSLIRPPCPTGSSLSARAMDISILQRQRGGALIPPLRRRARHQAGAVVAEAGSVGQGNAELGWIDGALNLICAVLK